jgi:hypothetical protein
MAFNELVEAISIIFSSNLELPHYTYVSKIQDGYEFIVNAYDSVTLNSLNQTSKKAQELLSGITFFSLLDSFIDNKYFLEGKKLIKKYEYLKNNTTGIRNDILRESYRIFRVFRNAIVHSQQHIYIDENITIEYRYRKKTFSFKVKVNKLKLLYTISFLITKLDKCNSKYIDHLICHYYKDFVSSIEKFKDNIPYKLKTFSQYPAFKSKIRYIVLNAPHSDKENKLILNNPFQLYDKAKNCFACDYIINYKGNYFIIPEEALEQFSISIENLNDWKLNECLQKFLNLNIEKLILPKKKS